MNVTVVAGDDGAWPVTWEVTAASGIPEAVFLCNAATGAFARVCHLVDFDYPDTQLPGTARYFRRSTLTITCSTAAGATAHRTAILAELSRLVQAQDLAAEVAGTTTYTIDGTEEAP